MRQLDEEIDKAFRAGIDWLICYCIDNDLDSSAILNTTIDNATNEYLNSSDGNSQSTEG